MNFLYSKYQDALNSAVKTRSFGVCYQESNIADAQIHIQDCCYVLLCLSPAEGILINDRMYRIDSGDLFVINQYEPYKIITCKDSVFARFSLHIHPQYLISNSTSNTDLSYCFFKRETDFSHKISLSDKEIAKIQKLLIEFRTVNGFGDDIIKQSSINTLLAFINQLFINHSNDKIESDFQNVVLKNTISYINSHISDPISLEILAKNSFISVNQLCKIFRNCFGTTVAKYIIAQKISNAKKLLDSGKSVSDTAILCGFYDYANFIRVFKKLVGISPGKYSRL